MVVLGTTFEEADFEGSKGGRGPQRRLPRRNPLPGVGQMLGDFVAGGVLVDVDRGQQPSSSIEQRLEEVVKSRAPRDGRQEVTLDFLMLWMGVGPIDRLDLRRGPGASGPSEAGPSHRSMQVFVGTRASNGRVATNQPLLARIQTRVCAVCITRRGAVASGGSQASGRLCRSEL